MASREQVGESIDLRSLLLRLHGERLPASVACEIAARAAEALSSGDVDPSSVLVGADGVVEVRATSQASADLPLESIDYLAPERLTLALGTDASAVYSLAATLYELLAAERLGAARAPSHDAWLDQRLSPVPAPVSEVLRECLAFEPGRRPAASELAARLRSIADGGETLSSWAARHLGSTTEGSTPSATWGAWADQSPFDVPVTRLPEPSPADPTYYLPDPTRPRPVVVPDLLDSGFDDEDVASEHTEPSDGTLRSPFADDLTEIRPRSRIGPRLAVAGASIAVLAGVLYALLPRTEAADASSVASDPIVEHDTPVPPGTDAVVFESAAPDTARVTVHCSGASARGATMASVPAEAAGTCTVTAILADRDRTSTVVNGAVAGRYRCFVEGSTTCQAE